MAPANIISSSYSSHDIKHIQRISSFLCITFVCRMHKAYIKKLKYECDAATCLLNRITNARASAHTHARATYTQTQKDDAKMKNARRINKEKKMRRKDERTEWDRGRKKKREKSKRYTIYIPMRSARVKVMAPATALTSLATGNGKNSTTKAKTHCWNEMKK